MPDILSLYTQNGIPVSNKMFEKVIFKDGLKVSPSDLIALQDTLVRDFDNFLFATRGQINGVYKTEYDPEKDKLIPGLEVSIQEATVLNPTSNYELKIGKGKAYIGGKLVVLPISDYVEIPDNNIYPDPITLHLILERTVKDFIPVALGQPGFAIIDGKYTSDRKEISYKLRLVDELPIEKDSNGNLTFIELAKLFRPPILKMQNEIFLNALDGEHDEGQNWAKYETNLHILNVQKVVYLTYNGETVTKIPTAITQNQWNQLNNKSIKTSFVSGVYYVPYTKNVLVVSSDVNLISQERIWYMPHTAGLQLTDMRYIIEDLPSVIEAAFKAVNDLSEHKTNYFSGFVPDGLVDEFTDGNVKTFWTLPIAANEPLVVKLGNNIVSPSSYSVINVMDRTYEENGETVIKECGQIEFNVAPAPGYRLTVDFYHDSHTLYVENAKHEAHRNDIDAHPNYINNIEFSNHIKNIDNTDGDISVVVAHDNRYYTKLQLDDPVTGKSDKGHDHDESYSQVVHLHEISNVNNLQYLITKIEENLGVYNKTTRLILEKMEQGVDGVRAEFLVDSALLSDETAKLVGIRADLTSDSIKNPVILKLLYDPSNGIITNLPSNNTIEDLNANFPIDGSLIGGHINPNIEGVDIFEIISNTSKSITVNGNIANYTTIGKRYSVNDFTPGGINPWTVPQRISYGGKSKGLVVSAVQGDDEVWAVWVDTLDGGLTHNLWWSTKKVTDEVWSPPVNTLFRVDHDCRPSIVKFPNGQNEDLMVLFTDNGNLYYSYISHGQTYFGDRVLFYDLPTKIYFPKGIYVHDQAGNGDKIWVVYRREENGIFNIYLRVFDSNFENGYTFEGDEILLSDGVNNCYFPTISQENRDGGDVWIAWVCDNSEYDNRNKPIITIMNTSKDIVVSPTYIPSDQAKILDNFNVDSKIELHHSADNIWLVYSVFEDGAFNVYYLYLSHDEVNNLIRNENPPVELNRGHEVSITERSDNTIWITYSQSTQVYNQVRLLGSGEVKWDRKLKTLEFEVPPIAGSFIELRWQLPFSDIEGRLEAVESEIRTHRQKLEQLAALLNLSIDADWGEIVLTLDTILKGISKYYEGDCIYLDSYHWRMPGEYEESKATALRIYKNGNRLRKVTDWMINGNIITFIEPATEQQTIIAEWEQYTSEMQSSSASSSSSSSESSSSL